MDKIIYELIISWRARAKNIKDKGLSDEFINFFIYYMCLDAWITNESQAENDKEKNKWLINEGGSLKSTFTGKNFNMEDIIALKLLSPIEDMRPNYRGTMVYLKDTENIEEVVNFIYQIRCNLFHGGKNPENWKDKDLVFLAGNFLEKWITCACLKI
jgi:hypothetical protein